MRHENPNYYKEYDLQFLTSQQNVNVSSRSVNYTGFDFLTAMTMKSVVICDVTPSTPVQVL
jgi:hypothetical protein